MWAWRTERHMQERGQAQCVRPLGKLEVVVVGVAEVMKVRDRVGWGEV